MNPEISINLCCYNSEKYLQETLDSIINQTYSNWELVIINDGSDDSTESIIDRYLKQGHPIKYKYQANQGLSSSRNEAMKMSRGNYIAFIDHDDIWLPNKLETQIDYLHNHPECGFLYSNAYALQDGQQCLIYPANATMPEGSVFRTFLTRYPVNLQTVIIKKTLFANMDHWFDNKLELCEEYDFFLRCLYNAQAGYQKEALAIYRLHPGMSSAKKFNKFPNEKRYILDKLADRIPDFDIEYSDEIKLYNTEISVNQAIEHMLQGDKRRSRQIMHACRFLNIKYFVLYLMTYLPIFLYVLIHEMRGGIILRQRLRYLRLRNGKATK